MKQRNALISFLGIQTLVWGLTACEGPAPVYRWQAMQENLSGALLSVWGTSERDVYVVGADSRDGYGPTAMHYNGQRWRRMDTTVLSGDLWWVYGVASDVVYMVGSNGLILKYTPSTNRFERQQTPSNATLFGVWGATANDVWAVGGDPTSIAGAAGVIWHYDGQTWTNVTLPNNIGDSETIFKVWGSAANDVWAVGTSSTTLHYDGTAWSLIPVNSQDRGRLFTIHGQGSQRIGVGGSGDALLLESDGNNWRRVNLSGMPRLNGVYFPPSGGAIAVGATGTVLHRSSSRGWHTVTPGPDTAYDFHSVWVDPTGSVWAVGGQLLASPMTDGMVYRFGSPLSDAPTVVDDSLKSCPTEVGTICTWAGVNEPGYNGDGHHRRDTALYWPVDLEFNAENRGHILDWNNHRIRRVNANDTVETLVGTQLPGDGDPMLADLTAVGALGTTVSLNHPTDLLFEPDGRMLIMAWHNHKLRRYDPTTHMLNVLCGRGPGFSGDDGPMAMALLKQPSRFARDAQGNLFIFDQGNLRIRQVTPDQVMHTIAGTGMRGFAGDNGPATMAQFSLQQGENPEPEGALAIDGNGHLYVADSGNNRIRMIDLTMNPPVITTIAGDGTAGFTPDGTAIAMSRFDSPRDLEIGPDGNLWVADTGNHCIRVIDFQQNVVRTAAGVCRSPGYRGDRGLAAEALLYRPFGIAFDRDGDLYIADTYNNRVRRVER